MKITKILERKMSTVLTLLFFLFIGEIAEAQTPAGVAYHTAATRRRTAVVVSSATKANSQQQAAAAAAATPAPAPVAAPAQAPVQNTTPPPASTEALLPIGSVVPKLPAGCVSRAVGGEEYYQCGANYYKAAYQQGSIVYLTVKPPQ